VAFGALSSAPARAQLPLKSWTFERPSYGALTRNIADDYLIKQNGVWHLFYTNLIMPTEPVEYIGHAVSTDLINWTEHAPAIIASSTAPDWRAQAVWAPMVASNPGGGWVMAYTGVSGSTTTQRIGFLTSNDLETWTPLSDSLPFQPDSIRYAWTATAYSNCRDPHLILLNGVWHLIYCSRRVDGTPSIGHAESPDLLNWTQDDPLFTSGIGWNMPDMESPGVAAFGGKTYLYWSQAGNHFAQGDSLLANWYSYPVYSLAGGTAPELIPNGNGLLYSRRRLGPCNNYQTYLWFDSLDTSSLPFPCTPCNPLPGFTLLSGNAFASQPTFGDGPSDRGETPADPSGLYWLSSREDVPEPSSAYTCGEVNGADQTGLLASDPFVLNGDSLAVEIQGASSPDSAYVQLRDECTQTTIVRFTGGSETLTPAHAWVGNARGRTVSVRIADLLTRPGGWIGVDNIGERASAGLGATPTAPTVTWTAPAGGEDVARAKPYRIHYTVSGGGTIDSLVVYLTDPQSSVLLRQIKPTVGSTNVNWVAPDTLLYTARLRMVAYAHSGAWGCATSNSFEIGAPTGVEPSDLAGFLRVSYDASGAHLQGRVARIADESFLEIFDLRGRRVAVPWSGSEGQTFSLSVAHDEQGRRLAPGVYFARLRQADLVWQAKFVQLR
jgi:hypothetical protein